MINNTNLKKPVGIKEQYVVAIGASAGGLEAIQEFFDNMPSRGNLSFVVLQHLSPDFKSLLVELLARHTNMKVVEAENDIQLKKDFVYVIPNNKVMTLKNGRIKLEHKPVDKLPNTVIDKFLISLAEDKSRHAIAVILSGTGSDGTKGVEAIKQAGGLVIVQDPATAKFDGMPNNAIASDNVDYILSPELMPEEIYNYINEIPVQILNKGKVEEGQLQEIFQIIQNNCDHDFNQYKYPTILRRIAQRMTTGKFNKLSDYVEHLRTHPEECSLLYKDFLIGVTRFFRDKVPFEILSNEVLPLIFKEKSDEDSVKVWVTACSSGEEAYSIAILIDQYLRSRDRFVEVKIFATDADQDALAVAGKGCYPPDIEKDVEPKILEQYFIKEDSQYSIIPRIRKQIVFARHNITKDPPFIKMDLVTCRNMLIYMNNALQKKVLSSLHFSLNTGGFLFLGNSENIGPIERYMSEVNAKWKIFRKTATARVYSRDDTQGGQETKTVYRPLETKTRQLENLSRKINQDIASIFNETLADEYAFAGLNIDHNYEIRDAIGNYTRYISLPEKKLQLNLLKMVPADLSIALNTAIRKAWKENKKVALHRVKVKNNKSTRYLTIIVKPPVNGTNPYTFVSIGEVAGENTNGETIDLSSPENLINNRQLMELENELAETKKNLQLVMEGFDTTNEELQSTNEELLSANEELQSSNEELQSLNEELHTLNAEHQSKIRELVELNDDLNNFLRSVDIGLIFLDNKQRIRKFNPAAVKMVNIIETDIGRPINHISTNIKHENLFADIQKVMETDSVIEKEVLLSNDSITLMRIFPYVRQDKTIDGVVITFVDISAIKDLNNIITGIFNASYNSIMAFTAVRNERNQVIDLKLIAANAPSDKLLLANAETAIGQGLKTNFPHLGEHGLFKSYVDVIEKGTVLHTEYELIQNNKHTIYELVAVKMMDGITITLSDITDKKESGEKIQKNYNELMLVKENLRRLNAELEDKVLERTRELTVSEERFRLVSKATNDTIWDWNLTNNSMWWSENITSMFGYTQDDNINTRTFWLSKLHPQDKERVKEMVFKVINTDTEIWTAEYRFLKKDGNYAEILDRGYVLKDEHDMPYRMLGSIIDVTNLRKAQAEVSSNIEQKRFLAEAMPLIVWVVEADGKISFINRQFSLYTGMETEGNLEMEFSSFVHPDDLKEVKNLWSWGMKNKKDVVTEMRLRRKDGVYRWHLTRITIKKDAFGNVDFWVGTNTDIHEQKLATEIMEQKVNERTEALRLINKQLEESNFELQQYAYVASHDLKEPLRKINMFANILKDRFITIEDEKAGDYMARIVKSSTRMMRLIDDLLNFSSLSSDQHFAPADLGSIIREIVFDLELAIQEKNAVIEIGELPVIEAIPGQMRQVFQNLISNALKFSKEGKQPHIRITSEIIGEKSFNSSKQPSGAYCRIMVEDNGIGFDEQYLEKIFTLFQRLHNREYEGTGIGLAVAQKIILKHSGLITARSKENEGAKFIIILPVKQLNTSQDNVLQAASFGYNIQ